MPWRTSLSSLLHSTSHPGEGWKHRPQLSGVVGKRLGERRHRRAGLLDDRREPVGPLDRAHRDRSIELRELQAWRTKLVGSRAVAHRAPARVARTDRASARADRYATRRASPGAVRRPRGPGRRTTRRRAPAAVARPRAAAPRTRRARDRRASGCPAARAPHRRPPSGSRPSSRRRAAARRAVPREIERPDWAGPTRDTLRHLAGERVRDRAARAARVRALGSQPVQRQRHLSVSDAKRSREEAQHALGHFVRPFDVDEVTRLGKLWISASGGRCGRRISSVVSHPIGSETARGNRASAPAGRGGATASTPVATDRNHQSASTDRAPAPTVGVVLRAARPDRAATPARGAGSCVRAAAPGRPSCPACAPRSRRCGDGRASRPVPWRAAASARAPPRLDVPREGRPSMFTSFETRCGQASARCVSSEPPSNAR